MLQVLKFGIVMLMLVRFANGLSRKGSGKYHELAWNREVFEVQVQRNKGNVVGLSLRLAIRDSWRFVLRRENWFDRFAKTFGIASEWQTGDAGFDRRVFILSEDASLTRALSRDRELREAFDGLLERQGEIECRAGQLYCDFPFEPEKADRKLHKEIEKIGPLFSNELATMVKVRDALQRILTGRWRDEEREPALARKAWLIGISMMLALLGTVSLFFDLGPDRHQVVREVIPRIATVVTVIVTGLLLLSVFLWLRSTPHTHAVLLDVLLAAAPGCWIATSGAATLYNEKFDQSPAVQVPVQVEGTRKFEGKGKRYYLDVERWPDPRGNVSLGISSEQYEQLQSTSCIMATWRQGRLGDGWVADFRPGCEAGGNVER